MADRLVGGDGRFGGADMSTKLKLLGVDVASFGDARGLRRLPGRRVNDPGQADLRQLVLSDDATTLLGGILVGDASAYGVSGRWSPSGYPATRWH